jgi:hypothetical protein
LVNATTFTSQQRNINFTNLTSDEVYYYNVTIIDKARNENSTETRKITLDSVAPKVSYGTGTESDGSYVSRDWIYVNVSVVETSFNNITFYLYNSSLDLINETNYTTETYFVNFTNLQTEKTYYYNVTVRDVLGFENTTPTWNITLDTRWILLLRM